MSAEIHNLPARRTVIRERGKSRLPALTRQVLQAQVHLAQARLALFDGTATIARWHQQQAKYLLDSAEAGLPAAPLPDHRMTESVTTQWLRNLSPARKASALVPSCGTSEGGDAA